MAPDTGHSFLRNPRATVAARLFLTERAISILWSSPVGARIGTSGLRMAQFDWSDCPLVEVIPGKSQRRSLVEEHATDCPGHHGEL